jgi:DNA-binding NtrC family response regulator
LFLDEIGEIDAALQIKLLRVLGERTFERVGSNKTLAVDVRLVAATNKDLEAMVRSGTFREDLFFRLSVVPIHLPPLRGRPGDIPLLAQHFLEQSTTENGKTITGFAVEAMEALMGYRWPGNVRELRTAVEHAVVLCRGSVVTLRDLPPAVRSGGSGVGAGAGIEAGAALESGKLTVKEAEKQLIIRALKESGGNRTEAARRVGVSRRTLHRKLHEYGLEGF